MLVVLEGIDGAGKSTVARCLEEAGGELRVLAKSAVTFDHNPYLDQKMRGLRSLIWPADLADRQGDDFGELYWIYLQAAWFSVLGRSLPVLQGSTASATVFDGWWYRSVAKLSLCGLEEAWLESLFASVPPPDLVVLLDIDPELVWRRRERFATFEIGQWAGILGTPFESFRAFQGKIREALLARAEGSTRWKVVRQEGAATAREIAAEVLRLIVDCEAAPRRGAGPVPKGEALEAT